MSGQNTDWEPELDDECNIKGPYPEVIDLFSEHFLDLDFSRDPSIAISNDENVKTIIASSNEIGISHIIIKNLPSLEEIIIEGRFTNYFDGLQWLTVEKCPSLKKVSIRGDVISINITGANSLEFLDINGCKAIDLVSISSPSEELKIDARGCIKLRKVVGLNEELHKSSGLLEQIIENQKPSREDGSIYDCMTFTDVDLAEKLITEGVKSLSRMGQLEFDEDASDFDEDASDFDCYRQFAKDKNFKPFGYRILDPLEPVYTGGTGETYGYVSTQRYADSDGVSSFEEEIAGNKSPEDCLRYMLRTIRMMDLPMPNIPRSNNDDLIEFLLISVFKENNDELKKSSLYTSDAIKALQTMWYWRFAGKTICLSGKLNIGKKKKEYSELIAAAGFKLFEEIRKGLSFLVHENPESTSRKVVRAKKLGISVISEEELRTMLASKAESN